MKKIFILFFLIVSLSIISQENDLIIILEVNSNIVDKENLKIISNSIYDGLISTNKYNILDKNELKSKLALSDIKITECNNKNCYKMIDKIINSRTILSGKIIKLDNLYILNIDCYDTQKDKIIFSFYENSETVSDIYKKAKEITKKLEDNLTPKTSFLKQISLYHTMQDELFDNSLDESYYKIDFENNIFCNVNLNVKLIEVMQKYKNYVLKKWDSEEYIYYSMKNGVVFIYLTNKTDIINIVKFFNKKMHTVEGFYIGDTVEKMKKLYGEPDNVNKISNINTSFGFYLYKKDLYYIKFYFNIIHGERSNIINCIEIIMR